MKKLFTLVSAVILACSLYAAQLDTIQVGGLWYQVNAEDSIATLIRHDKNFIYEQDTIVIPVNVIAPDSVSYPIVAIGQAAFSKTTASSITFAKGSKVTTLGTQVFQYAVNLLELELPEGVKLLPMTSIHSATAANPMQLKQLTLPATLDSLDIFATALPQLEYLIFKGATPPSIRTVYKENTGYTQNPWEVSANNACNTAKTAKVLVPRAAVEAYKATPWIGDYFETVLAIKDTIESDGLYFELDNLTQTASLIRLNASFKYELDTIVIPVSVTKDELEYPVVALGQGALRNTTASVITFAEGSKVTELGMQAFQAAVNVQELELPEGIKIIPMTAIHNATASNPMKMKKLILPSTVDSIVRLSICLPQLDTLEFRSVTPPSINTFTVAASGYVQNPWEVNVNNPCNTNKEAVVIVPEGSLEAYKNTAWIGDYFTTIVEKKEPVVELANIAAFNAAEDGATYKLTLTDAKVTAFNDLFGQYYVEDATAATVFTGAELTVGTALNGTITGTKKTNDVDYINDPAEAVEYELAVTDATGFEATETTLTPTVMTIAEASRQENYAKLITIKDVKATASGKNQILTDSAENTIKARDLFGVLSTEFTWPEELESITGINLYYMNGWYIMPTSEEGIVAKDTEAVEETNADAKAKAVKFIQNGNLYIRYNGKVMNVLGN